VVVGDGNHEYANEEVQSEKHTCAANEQDNKPIEAVEPTTQDITTDEWELEQLKVGSEVAQALAVLTAAGLMEWQVGSWLARACLRVHVSKYDPLVVCERGEWPEEVDFDEVGEPRQEFFEFEDGAYEDLVRHIHRNWVYPPGY
jgi:hypothetical protein